MIGINGLKKYLGFMDLLPRAKDLVKTYSGGMMRKLELAEALINHPKVLSWMNPLLGWIRKHELTSGIK